MRSSRPSGLRGSGRLATHDLLCNRNGMCMDILPLVGIVTARRVPDRCDGVADVVLGLERPDETPTVLYYVPLVGTGRQFTKCTIERGRTVLRPLGWSVNER